MIMVVKGKHREILIDLLIYYLDNTREQLWKVDPIIDYIKERDSNGEWYIEYYIDDFIY